MTLECSSCTEKVLKSFLYHVRRALKKPKLEGSEIVRARRDINDEFEMMMIFTIRRKDGK